MIDESEITDLIDRYIRDGVSIGIKEAKDLKKKIKRELMATISDYDEQDEILERLDNAKEEWEKENKGGFDKKDFIKRIDKQLEDFTLYKAKSGRATPLKYNHLKDLDLDSLSLKEGITKEHWKNTKPVIQILITEGKQNDIDYIGKLSEALHQLSTIAAKGTSSKDMKLVYTRAEDIFDDIVEVDLKLAKGRNKVYKYWKGISHKYDVLVDTLDELQDVAKEAEIPKEMKVSIGKLQVPPNYIKKLQPFKMNVEKPEYRILELFDRMFDKGITGTPLGKPNPYEEEHFGSKGGDFLSQQKPYSQTGSPVPKGDQTLGTERVLSGKEQAFLSENAQDFVERMVEGYVDPILWYIIDELDIPVTMVDAFEKDWEAFGESAGGSYSELDEIETMLTRVIESLSDSPQKDRLNVVLSELEKTAGEKVTAYLPIANWLKDIEGLKFVDDMDKIERDTGKFFDQLGEIFIEGGQFPISMDTTYPKHRSSDVGGEAATSSFDYGPEGPKPTKAGQREARAQRFISAKKTKVVDENFAEIQMQLFEIINAYYFEPLDKSGNHFVSGDKPKFTDDVKGQFPYRLIEFNFSSTPSAKAEKQLLEGAADEINISNLSRVKKYLGSVASEKIHEGIPTYIREVELTVKALNQIFPNNEEGNKLWGANKIGRALKRTLSEVEIDEIKPNEEGRGGYFDEPLLPLYEKSENMEGDFPINSLRTFLAGDNLQNVLRGKSRFQEDKDSDKIFELIKDIIDLTDPEKYNDTSEVSKAILKVHDSIRKMENKRIVYGTMYLDDINTMDYIINKMEREFKLDVTALEINSIVKSYESFENLSKRHGIGKEAIYVIKGLCR